MFTWWSSRNVVGQPIEFGVETLGGALLGLTADEWVNVMPFIVFLAVAAAIGGTISFFTRDRPEPVSEDDTTRVGYAWREGEQLVIAISWPLPPSCVFCGHPSSHTSSGQRVLRRSRLARSG